MGRALARLHEGGVVHRDLKPENVFVTSADHVKIGDFGVAGRVTRHSLTHTGDAFGTPLYMSPEHLEARLVTPTSDVYSLGIVFYEMLTGICPFAADTPVGIVHRMLTHTPEEASLVQPEVPRAWSDAVRDMMSRDPDGRPSLAQVIERLDTVDA